MEHITHHKKQQCDNKDEKTSQSNNFFILHDFLENTHEFFRHKKCRNSEYQKNNYQRPQKKSNWESNHQIYGKKLKLLMNILENEQFFEVHPYQQVYVM